jgi:hypothetical protein
MTRCGACGARCSLFLCEQDIDKLAEMIEQLPWLASEIEVTRCRQDRLTVGNTRRSAETLSPINVGAMDAARDLARLTVWLAGRSAREIALREDAGDVYAAAEELIGDPDRPDSRPGRLLVLINRSDRMFAGLCPTLVGRDSVGRPVECATPLYGVIQVPTTTCPRCGYEIDVAKNRSRCAVNKDQAVESRLLQLLEELGEPVPQTTFRRWVTQGRIGVLGWMHAGTVTPRKIRYHDARVFSISQTRALRAAELSTAGT